MRLTERLVTITKIAYSGDGTLNEEEIIKGADKCLRLLMDVPYEKFTQWENAFLSEMVLLLNEQQKACSYRELLKLREIVKKYAQ